MRIKLHVPNHNHLVTQATWAAILVALTLIFAKAIAWWLSGSCTLQASLLDSISDFISSMINFFAVRYSRRPATDDYRFGHGKAEALGGFVQSFLIIGSTLWMIWHSTVNYKATQTVSHPYLAIGVMAFSTLLTLGLVFFQMYTIKRTNSIAVKADYLHYQADTLSNIAAIVALVGLSWFGIEWIDQIFGIGIAVFLFFGSWGILTQSSSILMDKELDVSVREDILRLIQSHRSVIEAHDLRTRSTGQKDFIQVHITLEATIPLGQAHIISDEVEAILLEHYPTSEILIHLDPLGYIDMHKRKIHE